MKLIDETLSSLVWRGLILRSWPEQKIEQGHPQFQGSVRYLMPQLCSTLIGLLVSLAPQFTLLLKPSHLEKVWSGFGAVQLWDGRCHTVQTCNLRSGG